MIASVEGIVAAVAADSLVLEVGRDRLPGLRGPGGARRGRARASASSSTRTTSSARTCRRCTASARSRSSGFFGLLLTVTGVGPKVALAILGSRPVAELQLAILAGDEAVLTSISGVGKRLAGRIILELKEKVAAAGTAAAACGGGPRGAGGPTRGRGRGGPPGARLHAWPRPARPPRAAGAAAARRDARGPGQGRPAGHLRRRRLTRREPADAPAAPIEHPCESSGAGVVDSAPMTDPSGFLAADLVDETEVAIERSLRPRSLDEYLGQREVKAGLSVLLTAARQRGEAADHVLLHGPPGLGKTTLATIIARELGVNIRYTSGPGHRAGRGPGRHPHLARRARRPLHRRDPPAQPGGRGDPVPGDGGLRPRRHDREGALGPVAAARPCGPSRSSGRRRAPAASAGRCATASGPSTASTSTPTRTWSRSSGARPGSSGIEVDRRRRRGDRRRAAGPRRGS